MAAILNDYAEVRRSKGSVLIITLWILSVVSLIAATLASEIRLGAKTVYHLRQSTQQWADIQSTLRIAEMELLLYRIPTTEKNDGRPDPMKSRSRFDGRILQSSIPLPETTQTRIFDHSGRINLTTLSRAQFATILNKQLGDQEESLINEMLDSWEDWVDKDSLKRLNGAEDEYYQKLNPPYLARNGNIQTPSELLLIRGFESLFPVDLLESSFTLFGGHKKINPNLATPETLLLLPELDIDAVHAITELRIEEPFRSLNNLNGILTPKQLNAVRPWLEFGTGDYYTIAITSSSQDDPLQNQITAYSVIVAVNDRKSIPRVKWIHPYSVTIAPYSVKQEKRLRELAQEG